MSWCQATLPKHDPKGIYDVLPVLVMLERTGTADEQQAFLDLVRERGLAEFEMAPTATSLGRRLFSDDEVESHLDALVAEQQDDGGWPISWEPPSSTAASEWRGYLTVLRLLTLRSYGRL